MKFTLKIWRQKNQESSGSYQTYRIQDISSNMSFLEMLDLLNEQLIEKKDDSLLPVAFDSDCREGICGMCSLVINGKVHGPGKGTTTCQLYMRSFQDGEIITIAPFRAKSFPVIKDLVTDRSSFDNIMQAGGYISINVGGAPDANSIPIGKIVADKAMDAAQCIGCGACVAACKNASAMLFVSAKVVHLGLLPQGQVERNSRVMNMVLQMDKEGFGNCTNTGECEAVCPKEISIMHIARMNRDYMKASIFSRDAV